MKRFLAAFFLLSGLLVGGLPTAAYADCSTGPYIDGNPTGYLSYTAGCKNDGGTTINSFTSAAGFITADNATPTSGVRISGTQQGILNFGTINSLNNSQTISGGIVPGGFAGIASYSGTIGTLINNVTGTISATIGVDVGAASSIGLLINSGTISGNGGFGLNNAGNISTITNTGTISNPDRLSILNLGTIDTLNNLQGVIGGTSNPLTNVVNLPNKYNVIIDGPTNYGQLSVSSVSGTMVFGIDSTDSTGIAAGTYPDVLQGFNSLSSVTAGTTGTIGTFSYSLVQGTSSDKWSLVVTANPASGSTPGGSVSASLNGGSIVGTPQFTTPTNPPAGVSLPYGVFGFTATVPITNPPSSITVTLVYPQALAAGTPIFKDTTGNGNWVDWTSNVTFNQNRTSITYTITDNGLGDSNPAAGVISDPIGPGISAAPAPAPTVNLSTASLAINATTLTIAGTNFDTTAGNNTVVFNNGAVGTVSAATANQLTVTFTTPPTSTGSLTAVVTTNGQSSGSAVQVATVILATQATLVVVPTPSSININGTSTLSTTGGSGSGAVSYTLVSGPCTLSGATLTGTGAGSCIVTATKAADSTYNSATSSQVTVVIPAPVDCVVSSWSAFGQCSASCGGGTQTQTRTVITPAANGGAACPALSQSQACNTQACQSQAPVTTPGGTVNAGLPVVAL